MRIVLLAIALALVACEGASDAVSPEQVSDQEETISSLPVTDGQPEQAEQAKEKGPLSEIERMEQSVTDLREQMEMDVFTDPWTGDLDAMIEQRVIRVLTVYGLPRYFIDNGQEKGINYEWFKMFEDFVNKKLGNKHVRIHVVYLPVSRDEIIPALLGGRGDIGAAGLTITAGRAEVIDFSDPVSKTISEVLVTGPLAPKVDKVEDLAGHSIYVRLSRLTNRVRSRVIS